MMLVMPILWMGFGRPACEGDVIVFVNKAARRIRGISADIQSFFTQCMVLQVLRALPAETKVDGLPRASSSVWT